MERRGLHSPRNKNSAVSPRRQNKKAVGEEPFILRLNRINDEGSCFDPWRGQFTSSGKRLKDEGWWHLVRLKKEQCLYIEWPKKKKQGNT